MFSFLKEFGKDKDKVKTFGTVLSSNVSVLKYEFDGLQITEKSFE
jgi:hypothetical protein